MSLICDKCGLPFANLDTLRQHSEICTTTKEEIAEIRRAYESTSVKKLREKYSKTAVNAALRGFRGSASERLKMAHKDSSLFKWSDDAKTQWSKKCKQLHAEKRANSWQKQSKQSYAERVFFKFLTDQGYQHNIDFFTEFPFSVYRVDFFFPALALVIEIDGKQHYRYKRRAEIDKQKDELLVSKGIDVLRISWRALHYDSKTKFQEIVEILKTHKRDVQISKFTNEQLQRLNMLDEVEKRKKEVREQIENKKVELRQKRRKDLELVDLHEWGSIRMLARLWGVSHTQASRFIRNNLR